MRIALCDDNLVQLHILADAVKNCGLWHDSDICTDMYQTGTELLESINSNAQYDYIFLDIEMPDKSGFDVCNEIALLCDVPVIFVSTHIELLPEAFAHKPYGFLIKPYDQCMFDRTIKSIMAQTNDKQYYYYAYNGTKKAVNCKSILYFSINNYILTMHLAGGDSIVLPRKRLDEVENETQDLGFYRCNRSILVNLYHCSGRTQNMVVIKNADIKIEISRRKLQEFDERLILYKMGDANAF